MTPATFWDISWREFFLAVNANNKREENEWRRMRELFALIYNVNVKKGSRKSSRELIPLPSDNNTMKEIEAGSTVEKFNAALKRFKITDPEIEIKNHPELLTHGNN